jgi:Trypsin-like peptidase domain
MDASDGESGQRQLREAVSPVKGGRPAGKTVARWSEPMTIRQICHSVVLAIFIAGALPNITFAQNLRAIPEDNLAYPVLIKLSNGSEGSGFYLSTPTVLYLVTANHVIAEQTLFEKPATDKPATRTYKADAQLQAISYSRDPTDTTQNILTIKLRVLQTAGYLKADWGADVAVMTVGTFSAAPTITQSQLPTNVPGATWIQGKGTVGLAIENVKTLDQVLVGNDVIMFGYPSSLGLARLPALDPDRPLLRRGIIAGKNLLTHSIILDCPAYFGNSGGPVVEIDRQISTTTFRLVGIVDQYVPFIQTDARTFEIHTNSGYSIAIPMDAVLRLIK